MTVVANPVFAINPTSKNFGDVEVGTYAEQVFTISNLGLNPLVIENGGISFTGTGASAYSLINTNPYPISITNTPVTITVRFTPPAIQETPYTANLQIVDNTSKATQSVPLTGSGVGPFTTFFSEGFNSATFPPAGWSNYSVLKFDGSVNATGYWERKTTGTYNSTAGAAFIKYNYSAIYWACLEAPAVNLPSKSKLVFYWRDNDSKKAGADTTYCEISTNGGTNWTVLASLSPLDTQTTYQKAEISLNAYAGNSRLIRFRDGTNTSSSSWGTFVDELSILGSYDYPAGLPVVVGTETITVTGGNANNTTGQIPPVNNASFVASGSFVLDLIGLGPWTVTIATTAPWGAYYQNGEWHSVENVGGFITFVITAAKDLQTPIVLGPVDPTLPVELSSFTATITSDLAVKIAWVAQSETNHSGYNVLRAEQNELATAIKINPSLIDREQGQDLGTQISYAYTDVEAYSNMVYYYWLESVALDGVTEFYGPLTVTIGDPSDPPLPPVIPLATKLMNAFPNPFNPNTNIRYSLKEAGKVTIDIYNVKGQLVRSFNNEHNTPGYYQVSWDGKDTNGQTAASGIYMYRMVSGRYSEAKKMILAK